MLVSEAQQTVCLAWNPIETNWLATGGRDRTIRVRQHFMFVDTINRSHQRFGMFKISVVDQNRSSKFNLLDQSQNLAGVHHAVIILLVRRRQSILVFMFGMFDDLIYPKYHFAIIKVRNIFDK